MTHEREMLAWAAGFFEGEGCVGNASGAQRSIILTIVNTDLDRLELFREIVNGGSIRLRTHVAHHGHKPQYQWQAYSENAVRIFRALETWLGPRRRKRFAEVLATREAYIAEVTAERVCPWCHSRFQPPFSNQARRTRFCSVRCGAKYGYHARKSDVARYLEEKTAA